jgi:hypothetical protein
MHAYEIPSVIFNYLNYLKKKKTSSKYKCVRVHIFIYLLLHIILAL